MTKYTNTGKSEIHFGPGLVVKPKETIDLPGDVEEAKMGSIKNLIGKGELVEGTPKAEPAAEESKLKGKKNRKKKDSSEEASSEGASE